MSSGNPSLQAVGAKPAERMSIGDAIDVLIGLRDDRQIVVTCMGSSREWPRRCDHPLDLHHVPSAMGATIPLALGFALAQTEREVMTLTGDGSLLMNLGALVTVIASGAKNLSVVLLDNGVYEITGGQRTAGQTAEVDFAGIARSVGFPNVAHFWDLGDWQARAAEVLRARGPRFIWLEVAPEREDYLIKLLRPMLEQTARLRAALGTNAAAQAKT
jgi:thiamine pyrophosphate-dependent acetolactate synthase large subunit-like protein